LSDDLDSRDRGDGTRPVDPHDVAQLERLLAHPRVRRLLGEVAREEAGTDEEPPPTRWQRLSAFAAGASSVLVVLLAFLIPSVEEQWDRFQSRRVIQKHVALARSFVAEGRFKLAEESFARAFELSENKRLDIDEERLAAKVQAVNADPDWGSANPEGLEESDFLYLLKLQQGPGRAAERAATLDCYGTFLASARRFREAEGKLREAVRLAPLDDGPLVSLGSLLRDRGRLREAEEAYRRAIRLDGRDGRSRYDLGLVLEETGRPAEALASFEKAVACDPQDAAFLHALGDELERNGRPDEAREAFAKALALDPSDAEARRRASLPR